MLGELPLLQKLLLGNNAIGYSGADSLGRVLGQYTALVELDLRGNNFAKVGRQRLEASWWGAPCGLLTGMYQWFDLNHPLSKKYGFT